MSLTGIYYAYWKSRVLFFILNTRIAFWRYFLCLVNICLRIQRHSLISCKVWQLKADWLSFSSLYHVNSLSGDHVTHGTSSGQRVNHCIPTFLSPHQIILLIFYPNNPLMELSPWFSRKYWKKIDDFWKFGRSKNVSALTVKFLFYALIVYMLYKCRNSVLFLWIKEMSF